MKMKLRKFLAVSVAVAIILTVAPMSAFAGLKLPNLFEILASAEESKSVLNSLTYEVQGEEVVITDCDSSFSGELVIPETIEGYSVTSIGDSAFQGCHNIINITIPASVVTIGEGAFWDCSFTNITVDEENMAYSSDEYGVLFNKDKTELIQYPAGNLITSYKIPDGVLSIRAYAFYRCSNLINLEIPDSVTSIGSSAFNRCSGLTSITIPGSVTSIDMGAFYRCSGLTSVTIPEGVLSIEELAFGLCHNLTKVTISAGVTKIGYAAFAECYNLTDVIIPDSVTSIADSTFESCQKLEYVHYAGTQEQWNVISIGDENDPLYDAEFHFCKKEDGVPVTCTTDGYTDAYYCAECSKYVAEQEVIPAKGHKYTVDETPATCTTAGKKVYTCDCGDAYTETFSALGHNPEYYRVEPTCTQEGYECYKCTRCGTEYARETIPVTPHNHVVTGETPATCTTAGVKIYTCECGDTYTEKIPALGHNPEDYRTEPTCTEDGYACYKCTVCSTEYAKQIIPATGHSYDEEVITKPTCTEEGLKRYTCSICGDSYDKEMPLAVHTITTIRKEPTCTSIGNEQYLCEVCGNMIGDMVILPKFPHAYGEWTIVSTPTSTENGSKSHSCISCGKAETVEISATGFETVDGVTIDFATNIVSGFNAGESSLDGYTIVVGEGYTWKYETSNGNLGTDSKAILKDGDIVVGEYTILVYGDVNGDGWYDGMDAVLVSCLVNGILAKDDVSEAVYMAADCNHDGIIDQNDVNLLNQAGTLLATVDQSKSAEVLLETSSGYVEYISLIDQTLEIENEDETDTPEVDCETDEAPESDAEGSEPVVENSIFAFFFEFIVIFEKLFNFILGFVNV